MIFDAPSPLIAFVLTMHVFGRPEVVRYLWRLCLGVIHALNFSVLLVDEVMEIVVDAITGVFGRVEKWRFINRAEVQEKI